MLQGLTEFLPISSTAHLLLVGSAVGFQDPGEAFTVMIQLGSILAVMWLYRRKIASVVTGLPSDPDARRFALMIVIAFLPAMLIGPFVELAEDPRVIAAAFIVGGVVMLIVEGRRPVAVVTQADRTPFGRALGIGVCQTLALVPGVSRSGATIVGARVLGLERGAAAEFSFFLAMPTMVGAFVFKLFDVKDHLVAERMVEIAIGFVMAFLAALVVVKPFLTFVGRTGFGPFAWYRIGAGIVVLMAMEAGWL